MLHVGDIVADRYRLLGHLGDGGSASVWKAEDRTLAREVAIKFLYAQDERYKAELEEQFLREARLACAVKHRNVIQTVDFGQTDDGQAYMVMELLRGDDLGERMGDGPLMRIDEAASVVAQILRGLIAVHDAGIVHRDLKPENVYLENDGEGVFPKILDFGIAKSVDKQRTGRRSVLTTKEGVVVGTPEYMSPEQARGMPNIDVRSDVWSVGVILFELLTGRLPFDHPYAGELIIQICTTDAPLVIDLRPEVGTALSEVVAKALTRDREQRFQTAAEMLEALLAATQQGIAPPRTVSPHPSAPPVQPAGAGRPAALWMSVMIAASVVVVAIVLLPRSDASSGLVATARLAHRGGERPHITVELRGVPDGAQVMVNGRPMGGSKFTLPNDMHARLIEVQASGRTPWRVMHPAGNDATYEVRMPPLVLEPVAAGGTGATATATPPGGAGAAPTGVGGTGAAPTATAASPGAPIAEVAPTTTVGATATVSAPTAVQAKPVARGPAAPVTSPPRARRTASALSKPTAPIPAVPPAAATTTTSQTPGGDDEEVEEVPLPKPEVWRKADF